MIIRKEFHMELSNRSTGMVIFSVSTDELEKATFDALWASIGNQIFNPDPDKASFFELRLSPLR